MEVVIALGILMVVGAVAVAAAARTVNVGTFTKNRTKAQELARKQIELLKVMRDNDYKSANSDWNKSLDNCHGDWGFVEDNPPRLSCAGQGAELINNQSFTIRTLVEPVVDDLNGRTGYLGDNNYPAGLDESKNMRRITIEVDWQEPFAKEDPLSPGDVTKIKIQTYLTNDALDK